MPLCYKVSNVSYSACGRRFALAMLVVTAVTALAQQSELETMASRVAGIVSESSRGDTGESSVLVFAFPEKRGPISGFGEFFVAEFRIALAQISPHVKLIEHDALQEYLVQQKVIPSAQLEPETGKNAARALQARYLLTGWSERKRDSMNLHIEIYDSLRGQRIGTVKGKLKISGDFEKALSGLAHDYSLDAAPPPKDAANPNQPLNAGRDGVGFPECKYCPNPRVPAEDQKKGIQGTVTLRITVDVDGYAHDIKVVKGLGRELDQNAIEAVRAWRFKPANINGKPVPVQVNIEVTFRLLK
jgi:TonB family protein